MEINKLLVYRLRELKLLISGGELTDYEKGKYIENIRKEFGLSYRELEGYMEKSKVTINKWHRTFLDNDKYLPEVQKLKSSSLRETLSKIQEPNKEKKTHFLIENKNLFQRNMLYKIVKVLNGEIVLNEIEKEIEDEYKTKLNIIKKIKKEFHIL